MTTAEILCLALFNIGMPNANYACDHMEYLVDETTQHGVSSETMIALIHYESRWTPTAVSRSNACGLTQVLPKYTKSPRVTCKQLQDPYVSIRTGAKVLAKWLKRRTEAKALCGYNAGFTCGRKYRSSHRGWRYSRKVQRFARKIRREVENVKECTETIKNYDGEDQGCGC